MWQGLGELLRIGRDDLQASGDSQSDGGCVLNSVSLAVWWGTAGKEQPLVLGNIFPNLVGLVQCIR